MLRVDHRPSSGERPASDRPVRTAAPLPRRAVPRRRPAQPSVGAAWRFPRAPLLQRLTSTSVVPTIGLGEQGTGEHVVISRAEAVARLTAPGEPFELVPIERHGVPLRTSPARAVVDARRPRRHRSARRSRVPRLRGRADHLRRAPRHRRPGSPRGWPTSTGVGQGRPGRHRHAQLPRVGRRASGRRWRSARSPCR